MLPQVHRIDVPFLNHGRSSVIIRVHAQFPDDVIANTELDLDPTNCVWAQCHAYVLLYNAGFSADSSDLYCYTTGQGKRRIFLADLASTRIVTSSRTSTHRDTFLVDMEERDRESCALTEHTLGALQRCAPFAPYSRGRHHMRLLVLHYPC